MNKEIACRECGVFYEEKADGGEIGYIKLGYFAPGSVKSVKMLWVAICASCRKINGDPSYIALDRIRWNQLRPDEIDKLRKDDGEDNTEDAE